MSTLRKTLLIAAAGLATFSATAQEKVDGFQFTTVKANPITPVKNQAATGTCWCFSTISFAESEAIRKGTAKVDEIDLSEMFLVSNTYIDKAIKFVRLDGMMHYGQGSSDKDVFSSMEEHGIVPNSVMPGLCYGSDSHNHKEMYAGCKGFMDAIVKNPNKKLTPVWTKALEGIVSAYLGEKPEKFTYNGKEYTPKSYYESLDLHIDEYVKLTSWTHIPYYKQHPVEVRDDWRWEDAYNLHLDELISTIDNAIENGFTVAFAADITEPGFTRDGIGIAPAPEVIAKAKEKGSDEARWLGITAASDKYEINGPVKEMEVTPEIRQQDYENKSTTDDHGMHIFGIAKDKNGTKYYMVKNSMGTGSRYNGIWYVSETYMRYKVLDIFVHKDAVPDDILKKCGIK